jgi:hypothetical protein
VDILILHTSVGCLFRMRSVYVKPKITFVSHVMVLGHSPLPPQLALVVRLRVWRHPRHTGARWATAHGGRALAGSGHDILAALAGPGERRRKRKNAHASKQ